MFCKECNSKILETDKFCSNRGSKIQVDKESKFTIPSLKPWAKPNNPRPFEELIFKDGSRLKALFIGLEGSGLYPVKYNKSGYNTWAYADREGRVQIEFPDRLAWASPFKKGEALYKMGEKITENQLVRIDTKGELIYPSGLYEEDYFLLVPGNDMDPESLMVAFDVLSWDKGKLLLDINGEPVHKLDGFHIPMEFYYQGPDFKNSPYYILELDSGEEKFLSSRLDLNIYDEEPGE